MCTGTHRGQTKAIASLWLELPIDSYELPSRDAESQTPVLWKDSKHYSLCSSQDASLIVNSCLVIGRYFYFRLQKNGAECQAHVVGGGEGGVGAGRMVVLSFQSQWPPSPFLMSDHRHRKSSVLQFSSSHFMKSEDISHDQAVTAKGINLQRAIHTSGCPCYQKCVLVIPCTLKMNFRKDINFSFWVRSNYRMDSETQSFKAHETLKESSRNNSWPQCISEV